MQPSKMLIHQQLGSSRKLPTCLKGRIIARYRRDLFSYRIQCMLLGLAIGLDPWETSFLTVSLCRSCLTFGSGRLDLPRDWQT